MSEGLSNNFLVKLEQSKANLEANLDLVEVSFKKLFIFQYCTDNCLETKNSYKGFNLKENEQSCIKNCFSKVYKLNSIIYSSD